MQQVHSTTKIDHTDILNYIIDKHNLQSYLEIGIHNKAHNFDKIKCPHKYSVDPDPKADADFVMTSDRYFSLVHNLYDIVFIDGLHHADQVKKDFENAVTRLRDGGFIVLHDTNPHSEHITHVPRDNGEWTGDVYKFALTLLTYRGIRLRTYEYDYGVTVVKCARKVTGGDDPGQFDYSFFNVNRHLINLVQEKELFEWI